MIIGVFGEFCSGKATLSSILESKHDYKVIDVIKCLKDVDLEENEKEINNELEKLMQQESINLQGELPKAGETIIIKEEIVVKNVETRVMIEA